MRPRPSRLSALGAPIVLLAVLAPLPAHATLSEALSMAALAQSAEHAALVEVVGVEVSYDEHRRIVTDASLRVVTPMIGSSRAGDVLVMRSLGGALGGLALHVEGEPMLTPGERAIVFLEDRAGALRAVGMSQGVLPVRDDPEHGEIVTPGGAGLTLVRPGDPAAGDAVGALAAPRPLDEVVGEILALGAER